MLLDEHYKKDALTLLKEGLENNRISQEQYDLAIERLERNEDIAEYLKLADSGEGDDLKVGRERNPLNRADFTEAELESLRTLAPEEYDLLL